MNTPTALLSPSFIFQVSHLYSKTGSTSILYSVSFVLLEMLLLVLFSLRSELWLLRVFCPGPSYHLPPYKLWLQKTELHIFNALSIDINPFRISCIILITFIFSLLILNPTKLASSSIFFSFNLNLLFGREEWRLTFAKP